MNDKHVCSLVLPAECMFAGDFNDWCIINLRGNYWTRSLNAQQIEMFFDDREDYTQVKQVWPEYICQNHL
jgi:hypothetical protein